MKNWREIILRVGESHRPFRFSNMESRLQSKLLRVLFCSRGRGQRKELRPELSVFDFVSKSFKDK